MRPFLYYLRCALQNIYLNRLAAFFSIVTLTLTLVLFGIFLLVYHNVSGFLSSIQKDVEISVYLTDGVLDEEVQFIQRTLKKDERISSFRYLSKEDALAQFENDFSGDRLLQYLGANPLPASFEVNVKPVYQNPDDMSQVTMQLRKFPGVEEVQYGVEWLKNFSDFLTLIKFFGMGIGGGLAIAVVTIIAHAIRLHFYDRSEEVEIMKLIGATHRFIKNPFLLEGILLGTLGGILSCTVIFGLFLYVDTHLTDVGGIIGKLLRLHFLPPYVIGGILFSGAFLGGIGGELSLTYLLRFRAKTLPKSRGRIWIFLAVLMNLVVYPVWAKEEGVIILNDQKIELHRVESEIKKKKEEKNALLKKEKSILVALEQSDHRIRAYQKDVAVLEGKIKKKEKELNYLSTSLNMLDQSIDERRALMTRRVRLLYREGSDGVLKVLIPSPGYPAFLKRLYYLRTIAAKEAEILSLFEDEQTQLEEKNNQLDQMRQQWVIAKKPLDAKMQGMQEEEKRKRQILGLVRDERAYYDKAIEELDRSSAMLKDLVNKLEQERRRRLDTPGTGFVRIKGHLTWPNEGAVVSLFGRQKHPRFDTYIMRKGIEIDASLEEAVRAVHEGVVVYANWFKGYGMIIILDHGDDYYSVYGHLSKLLVSVGEKAGREYTIGTVGETGLSEGKRLYFEIRHRGEPMDPLLWLASRG